MEPKIFCIGLSRTGTTTTHQILKELGFKSIHYVAPLLGGDWSMVDHHEALCDTPIPLLFKECDERYPNSKFILTTRNKTKWLDSMKWMFKHGRVIWNWPPSLSHYHKKIYGTNRYHTHALSKAFDQHHEAVKKHFENRPLDLLEINIDEGFDIKSICDFLGIPAQEVSIAYTSDRRKSSIWQTAMYYAKYTILVMLEPLIPTLR